MIDSKGMREFVAVVEQGGFTAAADMLDVSSSLVSRRVTWLENHLQSRLLNRSTRVVRLTEVGRTYYERSREILDQLEALESDMAEMQHRPKGIVRMTAAGIYAEQFVAPAVADFVLENPEVSVQLDAQMRLTDIVAEGYDLAVRMAPMRDSSLIARKIARRRVLVCGSPRYFARQGRPMRPRDLLDHNCLQLPGMPWRFEVSGKTETIKVQGNMSSNNGRALVEAAVNGLGLVRMSDYYLADAIHRGGLEIVLSEFEVSDAATWLVYPARRHLPARVRCLIDHLALRLADKPALWA